MQINAGVLPAWKQDERETTAEGRILSPAVYIHTIYDKQNTSKYQPQLTSIKSTFCGDLTVVLDGVFFGKAYW